MMQLLIPLALLAVVAAWWWFLNRASGHRMWSPIWLALSATAAATLFVISGGVGYRLSRHERFIAGTAWSGSVIWWEVSVGIVLVPVAVFFWRRGLRTKMD